MDAVFIVVAEFGNVSNALTKKLANDKLPLSSVFLFDTGPKFSNFEDYTGFFEHSVGVGITERLGRVAKSQFECFLGTLAVGDFLAEAQLADGALSGLLLSFYIAFAFALDFFKYPLFGSIKYLALYLPFALFSVAGPLLRFAAFLYPAGQTQRT